MSPSGSPSWRSPFQIALVIAAATVAVPAAQWLNHPTAGIPRKADGKADLAAPVPRSADGKPIIAGLWRPAPGIVGNITRGMNGAEMPYRPWSKALYDERQANNRRGSTTTSGWITLDTLRRRICV
jgi:hypothetical protein